ncbi:unnamed protein product [Vicia faba]|uniref:Uncharacterized protein n=1 Tax=Vicia faba TaxID=3906 RepID=A0AAV1ABA1_VICFA|nr:unnamed protein product [Vicia faba]
MNVASDSSNILRCQSKSETLAVWKLQLNGTDYLIQAKTMGEEPGGMRTTCQYQEEGEKLTSTAASMSNSRERSESVVSSTLPIPFFSLHSCFSSSFVFV